MRFQKLLICFLVLGSSLSLVFAQTALSVRKTSSSKFGLNAYQKGLEDKADAAETQAKESDTHAAVARQNLQELQGEAKTMDRKAFAQKQLDLKSEVARAEANAATFRADAARLRTQSIRDQANTAAKLAASDPSQDRKSQSKQFEAEWIKQLVPKSEQELAKAEKESARLQKIANEANQKAMSIGGDMRIAEARESARMAKLAEEEARATAAREEKSRKAFAAEAEKFSGKSPDANTTATAEKAKARELEAILKAEQESARKAQLLEAATAKEAARKAQAAAEASQKEEAARIAAARRADENQKHASAIAEKAKARELEAILKAEQESARKEQLLEAATTKEAARKAQAAAEASQKEEAARIAAARRADEKQRSELDAALAAEARKKAKTEEFFRAKKIETAPVAPVPVTRTEPVKVVATEAAPAPATDSLTEILRKKQAELDAQEAAGKSISAQNKPTVVISKPAPVAAPIAPAKPAPPMAPVTPAAPKPAKKAMVETRVIAAQPAASATADDRLTEILRQKQAELDAAESSNLSRSTSSQATTVIKTRDDSAVRVNQIEAEIKAREAAINNPRASQNSTSSRTTSVYAPPTQTPSVELNSKEAHLEDLLRKYKADQISPRDYHLQRAKIIAEP